MGRKRGSRFRKAIDAQEQLEGIEKAQRKARGEARKKRPDRIIERIDKSQKRFDNACKRIRTFEDAPHEFPT